MSKTKHTPFLLVSKRKWFRLFFRVPAIILGLLLTYFIAVSIDKAKYNSALNLTIALIIVSILEFVIADIITDYKYPPSTTWLLEKLEPKMKDYSSKIKESLTTIVKSFKDCDVTKVSSVFLLKVDLFDYLFEESQQGLLQITDYEGPHSGKKWRFFYSTKGIVGKCMRTEIQQCDNFDENEYDDNMILKYGYTKTELRNHNRKARSYLAFPLTNDSFFIGILYFFSEEINVFPESVDKSVLDQQANRILGYLEGAKII